MCRVYTRGRYGTANTPPSILVRVFVKVHLSQSSLETNLQYCWSRLLLASHLKVNLIYIHNISNMSLGRHILNVWNALDQHLSNFNNNLILACCIFLTSKPCLFRRQGLFDLDCESVKSQTYRSTYFQIWLIIIESGYFYSSYEEHPHSTAIECYYLLNSRPTL